MRFAVTIALLLSVFSGVACGVDCEEYCAKMDDCNEKEPCDKTQCAEFCEMALDNDQVGFEGSAQCAMDASCNDLRKGACFPYGDEGVKWCS